MADAFDPNNVPIALNFNLPQIQLVLKGLGKLPIEEGEGLYSAIRQAVGNTLQKAEAQHQADAAAAAKQVPLALPSAPKPRKRKERGPKFLDDAPNGGAPTN